MIQNTKISKLGLIQKKYISSIKKYIKKHSTKIVIILLIILVLIIILSGKKDVDVVNGCTDSLAINYDALANTDDGSCIYVGNGCIDVTTFGYDKNSTMTTRQADSYTILSISNSGSLTINNGGTLNIRSLELTPNTNSPFKLTDLTVSKEMTRFSTNLSEQETHFTFNDNNLDGFTLDGFTGTITYNYVDNEMGDNTHDLSINIYNRKSQTLCEFIDEDDAEFKVTHTFNKPTSISKIFLKSSTKQL